MVDMAGAIGPGDVLMEFGSMWEANG